MVDKRHSEDGPDRFGLDETGSRVKKLLGSLMPQTLARRAVSVSVSTDKDSYAVGEPIDISIEFANRFLVPVTIETPRQRLWGWSVDGLPEASDEQTYVRDAPNSILLNSRERRRIHRRWDGQFKRTQTDGPTRWEQAQPGTYEISAYLALGGNRPESSTTIRIEG